MGNIISCVAQTVGLMNARLALIELRVITDMLANTTDTVFYANTTVVLPTPVMTRGRCSGAVFECSSCDHATSYTVI